MTKKLFNVGDTVMAFDAGHRMDPLSWESLGDQMPNNRQFWRKAKVVARKVHPALKMNNPLPEGEPAATYDLMWIDDKKVAEGLNPEACAISHGHFDPMTVEEWEKRFLNTHEIRVSKDELTRVGDGSLFAKLSQLIVDKKLFDGDKIRLLFEQTTMQEKQANKEPDTVIMYEHVPMCLCGDMVGLCERFKVEVSYYTKSGRP